MNKSTRLSTLLAGTTTDTRATVLLHLFFWLVTYSWFVYQSRWLSGGLHPKATTLMALSRNAVVLVTFYSVSYFISPRRYVPLTWLLVVALLLLSVLGYCLLAYYLYNWIKLTYPDMPSYFNNIVGNISRQGPWTFLHNSDVLYFPGIQIVTAFFIPFAIKGLRVMFRSQVRSLALEKDNLRLELDFLRAQINPHFLFNTLNSVYSLIEDKDKTAATIVGSLSNMMRYALYESAEPKVEVAKELEFIQHYIEIQRIRHRRRLDVTIDISPTLGPQYIPPLLLINFVENAIKHGIDKLLKGAWIRIRAHRDAEGAFCFSVVNAKPGRSKGKINEGIGIQNTRRRLHILYPCTHSLHIKYTENQYEILVRIWQ